MNMHEFVAMIKSCGGKKRKAKEITEIFRRLASSDAAKPGEISFEQFEAWFLEEMKSDVRAARVLARQLFKLVDVDDSGTLSKAEFSHIADSLKNSFPHVKLDPPFDLDMDWHNMCVAAADAEGNAPEVIAWEDFERWWRERSGDDEGSVPVLPEAMANRVAEMGVITTVGRLEAENPHWSKSQCRWAFLKPRLLFLMQMEAIWGKVADLYGTADSVFKHLHSLPPGIRSPESRFTQVWDLAQLICIVYIAIAVPWRLGFDVTVAVTSVMFWWDVLIDSYFIVDVVLNFRLAYYTTDGELETDRTKIRTGHSGQLFYLARIAAC